VSPASKEEIAAVIAETQRIHDSQPPHRLVDAQGREPAEERPVVVTERMRLSYPIVVSLLTLTVVVAGSFARGQALAQQTDAVEARVGAVEKAAADAKLAAAVELAENRAAHRALLEAIERVEKAVEKAGSNPQK